MEITTKDNYKKLESIETLLNKIDLPTLKKDIYGNGKNGIKADLAGLLVVNKFKKWFITTFCIAIIGIVWSSGYFAFKASVNNIVNDRVNEKNSELVAQIKELQRLFYEIEIEINYEDNN